MRYRAVIFDPGGLLGTPLHRGAIVMQYAFGNTDIAARRLQLLAEVFAESSQAFLLEAVVGKPRIAVDLGCGPGYSTHFLANVLRCDQVVGLDHSEHFISLAQQTTTEKVSFFLHDVTAVPFPPVVFCLRK